MALRNEYIVRVFDLGVLPSTMPCMVLEFLDGIDLRSLLDHTSSLSTQEAVDYTLQTCEALAEAHLHGVVHSDVKPQTLFRIQRANLSLQFKARANVAGAGQRAPALSLTRCLTARATLP